MTGLTIDQTARGLAEWLERRERLRSGATLRAARTTLARLTGVSAGTFENLGRDRIKGAREWMTAALRTAVIRELEADIARHQHELAILRLSDRRIDQEQVAEVEAGLASLRGLLRGAA